jgi:hypothetical protein
MDSLDLQASTEQEFPGTAGLGINYKVNISENRGFLETWRPDEPGTPEFPRPKEFPMGQWGIEVYREEVTPEMVAGDVASHILNETNPDVKEMYSNFISSLTNDQQNTLQAQYEHSQKHEGETRSFEDWKTHTGLPGYFRADAFNQWEGKADEMYTKDQQQGSKKLRQWMKTSAGDRQMKQGFDE